MSNVTVHLYHHPVTHQSKTMIDGVEDLFFHEKYEGRIQNWFEQYIEDVHIRTNEDQIEFKYFGCEQDFFDVVSTLQKRQIETKCVYDIQKELDTFVPKQTIEKLLIFMDKLKMYIQQYQPNQVDDYLKILDMNGNKAFQVAVIACMSSGKSTLINALLGKEILPALNEATTAKVMHIRDVDGMQTVSGWWYDEKGKELAHNTDVTLEVLKEQNSNQEVKAIRLETDITWVDNLPIGFVELLDTPGPNNSQDATHRHATMSTIHSTETAPDLIIYVMDTSKMEVDDDRRLLEEVSAEIKKGGIAANDRFIFVLNRIDVLDEEQGETPKKTVEKAKNYLKNTFGIQHPHVLPVSALMALLERKKNICQSLTKKQTGQLSQFQEEFSNWDPHYLVDVSLCPTSLKQQYKERHPTDITKTLSAHSGIMFLEHLVVQHFEKYSMRLKLSRLYREINMKLVNDQQMVVFDQQLLSMDADIQHIERQLDQIRNVISQNTILKTIFVDLEHLKQQHVGNFINHYIDFETRVTELLSKSKFAKVNGIVSAQESIRWGKQFEQGFANEVTLLQSAIEQTIERILQSTHQEMINNIQQRVSTLLQENQIGGMVLPSITVNNTRVHLGLSARLNEITQTREETIIHEVKVQVERAWYNPMKWFGDTHYEDVEYQPENITHVEIDVLEAISTIQKQVNREKLRLRKNGEQVYEQGFASLHKELEQYMQQVEKGFDKKTQQMRSILHNKEQIEIEKKKIEKISAQLKDLQQEFYEIMALA